MLPALALSFAVPAVAGQNVGAKRPDRVRETFRSAAIMSTVLMVALTLLCQLRPAWLVQGFTDDPAVVEVAVGFLRVISLNFIASGLIFVCSGMFQALGNTLPALASSAGRLLTFVVPVAWLACRAGGLAGRLASAPHRARLVPVSRERCAASRYQPTSAAPRDSCQSFRRSSSASLSRRM